MRPRTTSNAARHRRLAGRRGGSAFTLIELLVVMTVIAILAAILFPAVRTAFSASHTKTTSAVISQLGMAVEQFREVHGRYPYSGPVSAQTLVSELGSSIRVKDTFVLNADGVATLIDAWSRPIIYVRYIVSTEEDAEDADYGPPVRNPKSYDLFSCGRLAGGIPALGNPVPGEFATFQTAALENDGVNYTYDGASVGDEANKYVW